MKKYIYITLFLLAACFLASCNSYDDPNLNPNDFLGNPTFEITSDTTNIGILGGERTIAVKTNTKWWTVSSNQSWVKVTTDTISGDGSVVLNFSENSLSETREVTLTFQSGTIGPKQQLKLTQDGHPAAIKVSPEILTTDAFGGSYELIVESNSSWEVEIVMDQDADLKWCTVNNAQGAKDGVVTIKVEKNANVKLDERTASIKFTASNAVQIVTLKQIGNASCDSPGNTDVLYFDTFLPCENSQVGDTWTLTDRRDNKTYIVRLMEDKQIWMIQDLQFAGDAGNQKENLNSFNGTGVAEMEYIPGYFGDVVYPTIKTPPTGTGYFYNWMGVMQDASAADSGTPQSLIVTEPYQGIAPFGWHIPSSAEYNALNTAFGSDPTKWGPTGPWQGAYGGNVNETATSYWGVNAYGAYWTCTQTLASETATNPQQKAHIWKFYSNKSASEVVITQPKKYGFTVRLIKNK